MKKTNDYLISSGNLYADIGAPNAEERNAKMQLTLQINALIKQKKLTQKQAAEILGIDQPKISALSAGKTTGFSLERLFSFLMLLGQDITIKIAPKKRSKKTAIVTVQPPKKKKLPGVNAPKTPSPTLPMHARKKPTR